MLLTPIQTKDDGDCAFHALFGSFNGKEYVCNTVKSLRKKVADVIRISVPGQVTFPGIKDAIEELIRNNERPLKLDEALFPLITLQRKKYDSKNEDFGDLSHPTIKEEYARLIETPRIWLLPCELSIIAYACNISVAYFIRLASGKFRQFDQYNPGQATAKNIYYNGINHYEAMGEARSIVNIPPSVIKAAPPISLLKAEKTYPPPDEFQNPIAQLKLLMLLLYRGIADDHQFSFLMEENALNGLAFKYKKPGSLAYQYSFIYAEYHTDQESMISDQNLLSAEKAFSLQTYFYRYQKLKKHYHFQNGEEGELCICTNLDFDVNLSRESKSTLKLMGILEEIKLSNGILLPHISGSVKYKFKKDFPSKTTIYQILKQNSAKACLAKALAKCVKEDKKIDFTITLFKEYATWLTDNKVIDAHTEKVTRDFIHGINLSAPGRELYLLYQAGENAIDLSIKDEHIDDFLSHIVFAVRQPSPIYLVNIIGRELGAEFNLINQDFIYAKLQANIIRWAIKQKASFQPTILATQFFKETTQQIARLALIGSVADYQKKLNAFGIAFTHSSLIQSFVEGTHSVMVYQVPNNERLACIEIAQTLHALPAYQKEGCAIIVDLQTALHVQKVFLPLFITSQLLVLNCDCWEEQTISFVQHLLTILSPTQKVIFITNIEQAIRAIIPRTITPLIECSTSGFAKLTEASKQRLQTRPVVFQGQVTSLSNIVDDLHYFIDQTILLELVNNENISIGDPLNLVTSHYIPQKFIHNNSIREEGLQNNKEDFFMICGNVTESAISQLVTSHNVKSFSAVQSDDPHLSRYIILGPETDRHSFRQNIEQFQQVCIAHPKRNIHLLKQGFNHFIWYRSQGSIKQLRPYLQNRKVEVMQKNGYAILSAPPGMGKTTNIKHMATLRKIEEPNTWVFNINLVSAENRLQKTDFTTEKDIIDFFIPSASLLAKKLFTERLRQHGGIVIFLDGFDEIQSAQQVKVIKLLHQLKSTKVNHMVITTRPYRQIYLENTLGIFSYGLTPIKQKSLYHFLKAEWRNALPLLDINAPKTADYLRQLISQFTQSTSVTQRKLIGIPLQAKLLADGFLTPCKTSYVNNTAPAFPKINLYELYQRFIDNQYALLLQSYGEINAKHLAIINEKNIKKHNKVYQRLALNTLFPQDVTDVNSVKDKLKALKTVDIIQWIHDKPHFTHYTFAEYFAAKFFIESLTSPVGTLPYKRCKSLLLQHIFKARYQLIRIFIETHIATSTNTSLQQNWERISQHNLFPHSPRTVTIRDEESMNLSSSMDFDTAENGLTHWLEGGDAQGACAKHFCKAVLNMTSIEDIILAIQFLNEIRIIETDVLSMNNEYESTDLSYTPENARLSAANSSLQAVKKYIGCIYLHYLTMCQSQRVTADKNLLPKNNLSDIAILFDYLDKRQEITPDFTEELTSSKIFYLSLQKHTISPQLFTQLKEVYVHFRTLSPYNDNYLQICYEALLISAAHHFSSPEPPLNTKEIDTIFTCVVSKLGQDISAEGTSRALLWLQEEGIEMLNTFTILTPKIAEILSQPLQYPPEIYAETQFFSHSDPQSYYVEKIWRDLLMVMLPNVDTLSNKNSIDKIAFIALCTDVFAFFAHQVSVLSAGSNPNTRLFTLANIQNLLKFIENSINKDKITQNILILCVNFLYLCKQTGLLIIDNDDYFLIVEPTTEFEYKLQLRYKQSIQTLFLFKMDASVDEKTFIYYCTEMVNSISEKQGSHSKNPLKRVSATLSTL